MLRYFFIFLFSSSAFAFEKNFDSKSGFMFGVGGTSTSYKFPSRFTGVKKARLDDKQRLIGGVFDLGYDVVAFKKVLLGVRAETMLADSLNMGSTENSELTESTKGKASYLNVTGRLGIPVHILWKDFFGLESRMVGEFFAEAGGGKYWATMDKNFTYKKTPNEAYKESIHDQRLTGILAAGFNLSMYKGSFFEIKLVQMRTLSNKIDFKGSEAVNGGASASLANEQKKNFNKDVITSFVMLFGHHW